MLSPPASAARRRVGVATRAGRGGFTLIELLVTIAIVAILASLLLPSLASAKERGRRSACLNHVRQFVVAAHLYAVDNGDLLPRGGTDSRDPRDTHTPIFSRASQTNLLQYTSTMGVLDCPNLARFFARDQDWRVHPDYGVAVGYHYLGGHSNTPWPPIEGVTNTWVSPQRTTDPPGLPLVADLNVVAHSYQRILAPHTARGAAIRDAAYFELHPEAYDQDPVSIGAEGGNVGLLDGSASWRDIRRVHRYRGSQLWDTAGSMGFW